MYIDTSSTNRICLNAEEADRAIKVKDSSNGKDITITYGKAGQTSTSWLASWNGQELGSISPSNIVAGKAKKLETARTVSGGTDMTMNFTYDGSGNSNANLGFYQCRSGNGNKNNYPIHRFAKIDLTTLSWLDNRTIFLISQGYIGGSFGIFSLDFRTNNTTNKDKSFVAVKWLVRNGFTADCIQIGLYNVDNKSYADAFFTVKNTYEGILFKTLSNERRGTNTRTWTLIKSSEVNDTTASDKKNSVECYTSIAAAATEIHNQAYTSIVQSTDGGNVSYAISAGTVAWGNISGKPSSYTPSSHTHSYAGSNSAGGSANSAVKLDTATAGSATQPVYFTGGKPTVCTYTLGKSVPADAKFTDTTYTLAGLMGSSAKGSATQPVYWTGSAWANTSYTLGKSVPSDAKFTDTVYSLPTASSTLGGVKTTSTVTNASGYTACPIIGGVPYYKDTNTTYSLSSFGINASAAELNHCKGVTSAIQTQLNGKVPTTRTVNGKALSSNISLSYGDVGAAAANHSHSYLPLSGGTVTGTVSITNTTAASSTTTGALKVSGGIGCAGNIYGNKVYGAVWNDYAEYRISDCLEPGRVVCEYGDDTLSMSTRRLQPGANIVTDTYGFSIGKTSEAQCPIAVSGRVLAYGYEDRDEFRKNIGRPVCAGPNGTVSIMTDEEYIKYGYCAIGTISAVPNYEEWGTEKVKVNNRIWIKV